MVDIKVPRSRLRREIALTLVAKLVALLVIWAVWYARPVHVDAGTIATAVYSGHDVVPQRRAIDARP